MIIVAERDEAEGLQRPVGSRTDRGQHLCHASYRSRLSLKSDFHEISLAQRPGQSQKPASHRDGLEFGFGALTIFQYDRGQNGTTQLNSWSAALRMYLGEVSHGTNYVMALPGVTGYRRHMSEWRPRGAINPRFFSKMERGNMILRSGVRLSFHAVILRKWSPSQSEGLPTKDLCIAERQ